LLTHRQTDIQTDRQTKSGKNITFLAEVINVDFKESQGIYNVLTKIPKHLNDSLS